jgi:hypothetical protein
MTDNHNKGTLAWALGMINMKLSPNKTLHNGKKNEQKNRYYHFKNTAYIIELTQNKYMICDESPKTRFMLKNYIWCYTKHGYATATVDRKSKCFHQVALTYDKSMVADHINRCKLDNRLNNLRIVTPQINCRNKNKSVHNKTGKIGVYRREKTDGFGRIWISYCVNIGDPERKLSYAKTYTKMFTVCGKPWNHEKRDYDDYFITTEEQALELATKHRLQMQSKLDYLGE